MEVVFNQKGKTQALRIVKRYSKIAAENGGKIDATSTLMDLLAANGANGNPELDYDKLEAADNFNLVHDVAGIGRHINRGTGFIEGCFLARCAKSGLIAMSA